MSQIQFLLNLISSSVNLCLIKKKCILSAILHNFIGTYIVVFNTKSIILVTLEYKCPKNKQVFSDFIHDKVGYAYQYH